MTKPLLVDHLPITNVTQRESGNILTIHFDINAYNYYLFILRDKPKSSYRIQAVFHGDEEVKHKTCPICSTQTYWCDELAKQKEALFQRLITFPSIRLYWLFV